MATKLYTWRLILLGPPVETRFVTLLAPPILMWFLDIWKIFAPLVLTVIMVSGRWNDLMVRVL